MSTTLEATRQVPSALPGAATAPPERGGARARWWLLALLVLGLLFVAGPFLWMILGSLKPQRELLQTPPTWLPENPTLDNYSRLWERLDFPRYFWNSTLIAVAITASNLVFCSMVGYALAKLEFAGKRLIMVLVLGTLLVPGSVLLVPTFVLMSRLGLVDSLWAVILPAAAGPVGVFLMRQFMLGIPDDLLEAARVDGAGEHYIFWRIVMPLSIPALAALAILTFLPSWNALLWPLVVLTSQDNYTLPVALAIFSRGQFQADYGLLMAGSVILVIPVIAVFLLLQRHFTQSIAMTGVKG
jgi:multiple sugar transport system permease protein